MGYTVRVSLANLSLLVWQILAYTPGIHMTPLLTEFLKEFAFQCRKSQKFSASGRFIRICLQYLIAIQCNTPRNTDSIDSLSDTDVTFKSELVWLYSYPHVLICL